MSYHHRKKRGQGGAWEPANIVYVCGSGTTGCHGHIEEHPNDAEREGFHVRPWEDPEDIPVKYHSSIWLLLLPNGDVADSEPREEEPVDE